MDACACPEVIALGEAMILVTPTAAEPIETAENFRLDAGGAESNVASHLAVLGHHAAWVGQLGDDSLGRRALRLLSQRGVDTRWVQIHNTAPTGVYFKDPGNGVQYFRRGSAASFMNTDTLTALPLAGARVVHLSGITAALSASCSAMLQAAVDKLARLPTLLSFDVNFRAGLWDVSEAAPILLEISRRADLLFVGLDEAATLWGTETEADVRAMLPEPRRLIVKDGAVGATEYSEEGTVFLQSVPTVVVEVVGAGDAFAAGYLSASLAGLRSKDRLMAGHARAALTIQSTSDFPESSSPTFSPPLKDH
jgi:2-dehydro-3-deoxygluconokinase